MAGMGTGFAPAEPLPKHVSNKCFKRAPRYNLQRLNVLVVHFADELAPILMAGMGTGLAPAEPFPKYVPNKCFKRAPRYNLRRLNPLAVQFNNG